MAWTFFDPLNGDSLQLIIGPIDAPQIGGVEKQQSQTGMHTVLGDSSEPVIVEMGSQRRQLEFSGSAVNALQHTHLEYWYQKGNEVILMDDLGTEWFVYIIGVEMTRILSQTEQWYFSWTVRALEA